MIVKMLRVYCVSRQRDRQRLLEAIRDLGVLHVQAIDPAAAVAREETVATLDRLGRAIQLLGALTPAGEMPATGALEAAEEALAIDRANAERQSRLTQLHRAVEQLALWGDVRLDQIEQLRQAGVNLRLLSVPADLAGQVHAEMVQTVGQQDNRCVLAVVDRSGALELPEGARELPLPAKDRPTLRAEAARIDAELKAAHARLAQLAYLTAAMEREKARQEEHARFTIANRSGAEQGELYAIQGWIPAAQSDSLAPNLSAAGVEAAVSFQQPGPDDQPPTLTQPPRWAKPIMGLFEILGTVPGYNEFDLSGFFMLALPLFAAMLIGDFCYGVIFTALPLLMYRKMVKAAGKPKTHLILTVGVVTMVWGVLTATYFGVTPDKMIAAGGTWESIGKALASIAPLYNSDPTTSQNLLMQVSFLIGTIHLTLAHIRRALFLAPSQPAVAEVGWCVFLWGMLGLIWLLFFKESPLIPLSVITWLLLIGGALVILFSAPASNPIKRIGVGFAQALLPALGAFSDTMSYIRLMAVGLASFYIADAFNSLSAQLAGVATWFAAAPVLVLGHTLNIGLAVIAIFAHGVRLNMLEFSNNAGVQWAGYPYEPFSKTVTEGE